MKRTKWDVRRIGALWCEKNPGAYPIVDGPSSNVTVIGKIWNIVSVVVGSELAPKQLLSSGDVPEE